MDCSGGLNCAPLKVYLPGTSDYDLIWNESLGRGNEGEDLKSRLPDESGLHTGIHRDGGG